MVDLKVKFRELLYMIEGYVAGSFSCEEMQLFAWEIIRFFTDNPPENLPAEENFERFFWYSIWQVQHLCDSEHENEGASKRELKQALAYMTGKVQMPDWCIGRRP